MESARLLHTHQDGPRERADSILARMFTATTAGGHPWSWTEVVQTFRSAGRVQDVVDAQTSGVAPHDRAASGISRMLRTLK
jgi:hypothetical protein